MHLLALVVISSLKDMSRVSLRRLRDFTLGIMVIMDFFMEKHLWNRCPCVFPWYRPLAFLLDLAGVSVLKGFTFWLTVRPCPCIMVAEKARSCNMRCRSDG